MVGISVGDDDMGDRGPLLLGNQAPEIEQIEVLAGVYRDSCSAVLDQKRVIQVVGDPHSTYSRKSWNGRGNDPQAVADRAAGQ